MNYLGGGVRGWWGGLRKAWVEVSDRCALDCTTYLGHNMDCDEIGLISAEELILRGEIRCGVVFLEGIFTTFSGLKELKGWRRGRGSYRGKVRE